MDEPFSREKAAQYYIVAWVKNWRIRTYLHSVGLRHTDFGDVHDLYPWMAKDLHPYLKNMPIKIYSGYYMKPMQDKLFDADTNEQRLKIAEQIEHWVSDLYVANTRHTKDTLERYNDNRDYRSTMQIYKASVGAMRKGAGHDWKTVK
jgi:hypothetical protein